MKKGCALIIIKSITTQYKNYKCFVSYAAKAGVLRTTYISTYDLRTYALDK